MYSNYNKYFLKIIYNDCINNKKNKYENSALVAGRFDLKVVYADTTLLTWRFCENTTLLTRGFFENTTMPATYSRYSCYSLGVL